MELGGPHHVTATSRTGIRARGHVYALVRPPRWKVTLDTSSKRDEGSGPTKVRCPMCAWEPPTDSLWRCSDTGAPEFHSGCGTVWNTFSTGGRCPGCDHQWQWTLCPSCGEWSPHEDWYTEDP